MQLQSNKSLGYTLIEILVGLSIISLLFSFGYINYRDFSRRQALTGISKQIQGNLRLAQQQALSGKKPDHAFCNGVNLLSGFSFRVVNSTSYRIEANCSGGDVLIRDGLLPSGVTITTPSPNPVIFKVLGNGTNIPAGQSSIITINQNTTDIDSTITITAGGEIK